MKKEKKEVIILEGYSALIKTKSKTGRDLSGRGLWAATKTVRIPRDRKWGRKQGS